MESVLDRDEAKAAKLVESHIRKTTKTVIEEIAAIDTSNS